MLHSAPESEPWVTPVFDLYIFPWIFSEPDTFGVYAVPGLHSHVFVGPFSNKTPGDGPSDVITLDDEDEDIQEVTAVEQPGATSEPPVRPPLTEEQKR